MNIDYKLSGSDRKALVKAIADYTNTPSKYNGMPTCSYSIGAYTVNKDGSLDTGNASDVELLIAHLAECGFIAETDEEEFTPTGIAIQMPLTDFSEGQLQNLYTLVEAKGNLIKKALGTDELPINIIGNRLDFPWFPADSGPEELKAYMHFITALCDMAKNQKRITAKEKNVDNEKYAFRCFLLRLGFIGAEYKTERKILLQNLSGSAAFKAPKKTYKVELDDDNFKTFEAENDLKAQEIAWQIAEELGSEFCEVSEVK